MIVLIYHKSQVAQAKLDFPGQTYYCLDNKMAMTTMLRNLALHEAHNPVGVVYLPLGYYDPTDPNLTSLKRNVPMTCQVVFRGLLPGHGYWVSRSKGKPGSWALMPYPEAQSLAHEANAYVWRLVPPPCEVC